MILVDSREKQPWVFDESRRQKLNTGDYTLEGFEDLLCVERKASVVEFAQNILQPRFTNVLKRGNDYKYFFLILEFDVNDVLYYPQTSNLSSEIKKKIKISGNFILSKLLEYQFAYNVKVIFAGNHGKEIITKIFRQVERFHPDRLRSSRTNA